MRGDLKVKGLGRWGHRPLRGNTVLRWHIQPFGHLGRPVSGPYEKEMSTMRRDIVSIL